MPVKNLAIDVVTASADTSVKDLARTMLDEELGDLVIAEDDKPVGIVTDRDIALAVARYDDLSELSAEAIMTPDPVTIHEDATAVDLPATMADGRVRRIPVVDDDGRLVGIATLDDVVATAGEMLDDAATVIEANPVNSNRKRNISQHSEFPLFMRRRSSKEATQLSLHLYIPFVRKRDSCRQLTTTSHYSFR